MIKAGVIGVGAMGRHHARVYSETEGVKLAGIADKDKSGSVLAKRFRCNFFEDYSKLLEEVDAVSICVPTRLHLEIAKGCIQKGKHCLIEKPVSDNPDDGNRLIELASKHEVYLMVGHIERFNPVVQALKKEIEEEELISINITRVGPFPPRIKDVGVIMDIGVHDIDIIRYLTGSEPCDMGCFHSSNIADKEDAAIINFQMQDGTLAHITTDWLTPFKERSIRIATKKRYLVADLITQRLKSYSLFKEDMSYNVKEIYVPSAEPLKKEIENFIEIIDGADNKSTVENAIKNIQIAQELITGPK